MPLTHSSHANSPPVWLLEIHRFRREYAPLNLNQLQHAIDTGRIDPSQPITLKTLKDSGIVRRFHDGVKLLANVRPSLQLQRDLSKAHSISLNLSHSHENRVPSGSRHLYISSSRQHRRKPRRQSRRSVAASRPCILASWVCAQCCATSPRTLPSTLPVRRARLLIASI